MSGRRRLPPVRFSPTTRVPVPDPPGYLYPGGLIKLKAKLSTEALVFQKLYLQA
jgi:hypothetical protein